MLFAAIFSPLSLLLFLLAGVLAYFFLGGFIWGAGFQPTPRSEVEKAGEMLGLKDGMVVYDLGSGFGEVVIQLAKKYPIRCVGVEIDPLKSWWSKQLVKRNHLEDRIEIVKKNLLEVDLSRADAIFVFLSGGTKIMEELKKKIFAEMKSGTKIVSYAHKFGDDWLPSQEIGDLRLYKFKREHDIAADSESKGPENSSLQSAS